MLLGSEKYWKDWKLFRSLPRIGGVDTTEPDLRDNFQVSVEVDREQPFTTTEFLTEQCSDPYCEDTTNHVGKLVFIYLEYWSAVLIKQPNMNEALKKLYLDH